MIPRHGAFRSFALLAVLLLPACSGQGGMLSTLTAPAPQVSDPLPQAVDLDQDRTRRLYLIVVNRLRQQGSARAALSYLDAYDLQYPNDPQAMLLRADCLVAIGADEKAEPVYRGLLHTEYQPAANAGLGQVAIARADWKGAIDGFQAAVRLSPSNIGFVNNLAYAQMRAGRYDVALETMRQAHELDPSDALIRNNLILCLQLSGHGGEAQSMLRDIPNPAERRSVMAMLARAGNSKSAILKN
jgi:Flp pilus assembly protein TadD